MSDQADQAEKARARVGAAKQEVFRLCREGGWRMSIPVDLTRDSDTVIMDGFRALDESLRLVLACVRPAPGDYEPRKYIIADGQGRAFSRAIAQALVVLGLPPDADTMLGEPITAAERDRISKDGP